MHDTLTTMLRDPARLAALHSLALMEPPPEPIFDHLTRLATTTLGAPIALISVLDTDRQIFLCSTGLEVIGQAGLSETPLSHSFCQYVLARREPLVIPDVEKDPFFRDHPAVRDFGLRTYAGVPLLTAEGQALGALCVLDLQPRAWGAALLTTLADLAAIALSAIERRAMLRELAHQKERFQALVRHASDLITVIGADGTIRDQSPASERLLGYGPAERVGANLFETVHPDDLSTMREAYRALLAQPESTATLELRVRHSNSSWRYLEARFMNLLDNPSVRGVVINSRDVTARRQAEERLAYQAFHDPLTDLPNRALFLDRLERVLSRARRSEYGYGVLFLDLDRFKDINDSQGHDVGDHVLVAVADRLRHFVRQGDTVARLGGDEFTVLVEDIADLTELLHLAERLRGLFDVPILLGDRHYQISTSIGLVWGQRNYERPAEVLRDADIALYRAKESGKGAIAVFDPEMQARLVARLALERDLRRALAGDEFTLHYQPIVEVGTGRIVEVEALLRWTHPERGAVSPAEFIPVAEEAGLIHPLGQWVLRQACRQLRAWQAELPGALALTVSVNLSAREFQHPDVVRDVARALAEARLAPGCLRLEITESATMRDAHLTVQVLQALKQLGVQLAIDDFGTGYSSLAYLQRFPVDALKIDRAFIRDLEADSTGLTICRSIASLGHALGLEVTAEGIETPAQLALVRDCHCDRAQGYFFARPLPAKAIGALLAGPRLALAPA